MEPKREILRPFGPQDDLLFRPQTEYFRMTCHSEPCPCHSEPQARNLSTQDDLKKLNLSLYKNIYFLFDEKKNAHIFNRRSALFIYHFMSKEPGLPTADTA